MPRPPRRSTTLCFFCYLWNSIMHVFWAIKFVPGIGLTTKVVDFWLILQGSFCWYPHGVSILVHMCQPLVCVQGLSWEGFIEKRVAVAWKKCWVYSGVSLPDFGVLSRWVEHWPGKRNSRPGESFPILAREALLSHVDRALICFPDWGELTQEENIFPCSARALLGLLLHEL